MDTIFGVTVVFIGFWVVLLFLVGLGQFLGWLV